MARRRKPEEISVTTRWATYSNLSAEQIESMHRNIFFKQYPGAEVTTRIWDVISEPGILEITWKGVRNVRYGG